MFKLSFRDFDAGHRGAATEERPPPPELRALTMRGVCRPPRTGSVAADGLGGRRLAALAADGLGGRRWLRWPPTASAAADGLGGRRWLRRPPRASVAADGFGGRRWRRRPPRPSAATVGGRSSVAAPRWPLLGGRSSVAATGGHRRPPGGPKGPPVVFKAPPGAEAARRRMSYDIKCYWRSTFSPRFGDSAGGLGDHAGATVRGTAPRSPYSGPRRIPEAAR